jgi:hypothetical protein
MNEAFLDRFPRKCLMETASNATLSRIIVNRTGLPSGAADMLANLIKTSEAMAVSGKLSTHLSLRPVLLFAADVRDRLPLNRCIETSILSALPASEMQAMRQHVLAHLDLVRLAAVAAPVPAAPAASAGLSDAALKAEMETMAHMTSAARDFAGR